MYYCRSHCQPRINCRHNTGIIYFIPTFAEDKPVVLASSISTPDESREQMQLTNFSPTPFAIDKNTVVAELNVTTPAEAKQFKPLFTAALKFVREDDSEQALQYRKTQRNWRTGGNSKTQPIVKSPRKSEIPLDFKHGKIQNRQNKTARTLKLYLLNTMLRRPPYGHPHQSQFKIKLTPKNHQPGYTESLLCRVVVSTTRGESLSGARSDALL